MARGRFGKLLSDEELLKVVEQPSRYGAASDRERLVTQEREAEGSSNVVPATLDIAAITELPSLFQPRGESLTMWPGKSDDHIRVLSRDPKRGITLDPVLVVAFGNEWFLVDGHHRIRAYRIAKWNKPIPVEVLSTTLTGTERVAIAEAESTARNRKNHLNLSELEKADVAWRMVVTNTTLSKRDTAELCGVSESTIGKMRRVKRELIELGELPEGLEATPWRSAVYQASQRTVVEGADSSIFEQAQRRNVARALARVLKLRVPTSLLLDVLEDGRPGITQELEEAIQDKKEMLERMERMDSHSLDI